MFETLFGEGQYALKFVIAFVGVLALIGLTVWLIRRFGGERLGTGAVRGRQPRLAVIDAASVDGRRRLVLIRRDNVEHLMMIGGPTDVVVEANIVRAAAPVREPQAPRPPAADTLPRAVPLGEDNMWPLQPEPAPAPAPAPHVELPPMPRAPQRQPSQPPVTAEEQPEWRPEPEEPSSPPPPQLAPQRRPTRAGADPLAGLADEISRGQPPQPEPAPSPEPRLVRRESRMPRPQSSMPPVPPSPPPAPPQAAEPQFNSPADQNLAEMAHRLEAALRRPGKPESFAEPPTRVAPSFDARVDEDEDYGAPPPPPQRAPAAEARPAARNEPRPARADKAGPSKSSLYDSLEQEMASLLGRPNGKN